MAQSLTIQDLKIKIGADLSPLEKAMRDLPKTVKSGLSDAMDGAIRSTNEAVRQTGRLQQTRLDQAKDIARKLVQQAQDEGRQMVRSAQDAARGVDKEQKAAALESVRIAQDRSRDVVRAAQEQARSVISYAKEQETAEKRGMQAAKQEFDNSVKARIAALKELERIELAGIKSRMDGWKAEAAAADKAAAQAVAAGKKAELAQRKFTSRLGGLAGGIGSNASLVGAAGFAGFGLATKQAIDFEKQMANVRKATEDLNPAEFKELTDQIKDMSATMPVTIEDLTGIAAGAAQLGIRKDDIASFTKVIAEMSTASKIGADEAASGMAGIATVMQSASKDYARMASTIVKLGNSTNATEPQILEMSERIAGAGHVIGLTEPQVLGFAAALASTKVEAQMGGTAISSAFIKMADAVATGKKTVQGFAAVADMSASQFSDAFRRDAAGAMTLFIEGLGRLPKQSGLAFEALDALGLSEKRTRDAMLRLAGSGDLLRTTLAAGQKEWEKSDALTKAYGIQADNTSAQMQIMENQIRLDAISIGNDLLPEVRDLTKEISGAATWFRSLSDEQRQNIVKWGLIASGILLVGGKLVGLAANLASIVKVWRDVATAADAAKAAQLGAASVGPGADAAGVGLGTVGLLGASSVAALGSVYYYGQDFLGQLGHQREEDAKAFAKYGSDLDKRVAQVADKLKANGLTLAKAHATMVAGLAADGSAYLGAGINDARSAIDRYFENQAKLGMDRGRIAGINDAKAEQYQGATDLGKHIAEQAATAVYDGKTKESCALFASAILKQAGIAISETAGAKQLRDALVAGGAIGKPGSKAVAGDVLIYQGASYGAQKYQSGGENVGYHVGIALGNGEMRDSSGGVTMTRSIFDTDHATAYTIPQNFGTPEASSVAQMKALLDGLGGKKKTPFDSWKEAIGNARIEANLLNSELSKLNTGSVEHDKITAEVLANHKGVSKELQNQLIAVLKSNQAKLAEIDNVKKAADAWAKYKDSVYSGIRGSKEALAEAMGDMSGKSRLEQLQKLFPTKPIESLKAMIKDEQWGQALDEKTKQYKNLNEQIAAVQAKIAELSGGDKPAFSLVDPKDIQRLTDAQARLKEIELAKNQFAGAGYAATVGMATQAFDQYPGSGAAEQEIAKLTAEINDLKSGGKNATVDQQFAGASPEEIERIKQLTKALADLKAQQESSALEAAKSQQLTLRLKESAEQARIGYMESLGPVDEYTKALRQMGLSTKDLTDEQKDLIRQQAYWDGQRAKIEQLRDVMQTMESTIQQGFQNILQGGKVTFGGLVQAFDRMVLDMIEKWAASQISKMFWGENGLFAAFAKSGQMQGGMGGGDVSVDPQFSIPGLASGGPVFSHRPYIVGERGPELFVPHGSGDIVPNHRLGGTTIVQHFHYHGPDAKGFRNSQHQIASDMMRHAKQLRR